MSRMKTLKITAFVSLLLITGFIGGFVAHRIVIKKQIERIADLRFARGFERELFRVIDADSSQREQLRPVVMKYSQEMARIMYESRKKRRTVVDSMFQEITPILDDKQRKDLEWFGKRFRHKERDKKWKKNYDRREKSRE